MALKDYLSVGTYSVIDQMVYTKSHNHLRFTLFIYTDSTKKSELAQKEFTFDGRSVTRQIKGIIEDKLPNPKVGEWYFVSPKSTVVDRLGTWAKFHGKELESPDKGWEYWVVNFEDEKFYYAPLDCYCAFNEDQEMEKIPAYEARDKVWWEKWFSSSVALSGEKNLHSQIYEYLKTTPGFENVKDT